MKKITIFLVCLCIMLLLSSCSSDNSSANLQLAAYEISGGSDSGNISVEQVGDIPWKTASTDTQSAVPEKTKTIIFDGKSYTGNYIYILLQIDSTLICPITTNSMVVTFQ